MFSGSIVALVTPFENGKVSLNQVKQLVKFHLDNGTNGIVIGGTTGESPTISQEELLSMLEVTLETVNGKIPVIAGTGTNNTDKSVHLTESVKKLGVQGVLVVVPYYNKPTQKGLYEHFKKIAEVGVPVIMYNIPSRTVIGLSLDTIIKLSEVSGISAIKEATGDIKFVSQIIQSCGKKLSVLAGDDFLTLPLLSIGGSGVISTVANVVPKDMSDMIKEFKNGNFERAKSLHYKMLPLINALFIETNPIPVKSALKLMGMISGEVRLPLVNMSEENEDKLKKVMREYELIR